MNTIIHDPNFAPVISALITALLAWIKRRFDLQKITSIHARNLDDVSHQYESQLSDLRSKINQLQNANG
jgi:hypothetical protein